MRYQAREVRQSSTTSPPHMAINSVTLLDTSGVMLTRARSDSSTKPKDVVPNSDSANGDTDQASLTYAVDFHSILRSHIALDNDRVNELQWP